MEIEVTSEVVARLLAQAARAAPAECCGVLLGQGGRVDGVLPAGNVAADPLRHFEIDPAVLLAAHRTARTGGPAVVGYYHSHPAGHPVPSASDCAHSSGDSRVWAIVAGEEVAFWRDDGGAFSPLSYRVVDG